MQSHLNYLSLQSSAIFFQCKAMSSLPRLKRKLTICLPHCLLRLPRVYTGQQGGMEDSQAERADDRPAAGSNRRTFAEGSLRHRTGLRLHQKAVLRPSPSSTDHEFPLCQRLCAQHIRWSSSPGPPHRFHEVALRLG